ncbi:MAG: T9SS type A sorting domain-containing protein [Ignavibacteria bacterium]|nr:T9SS type A sorting domain-containing protein [Ignavibacteria bacterium]
MILNKCIITNVFLIIIFHSCGINVSAQNQTDQLNTIRFHQNHPNRFNPSTSFNYAVSSKQFVSLKVYDVLGNEIATLVNEEKSAGTYEVEFDGAGLPSGIYFYQLKADSYINTKKMIIIK